MKTVKFLAPNQCYFFSDNKIVFQSYDTIVCTIENGKVQITEGQPQSTTTAKWLNRFLELHVGINNYKNIDK
jgi:ArsR family metal-binding transcriptional regulator